MSLFDQRDLAEIRCPDYPLERLVACFNPFLAEERRRKRQELLGATEKELGRIAREVARRTQTPLKKDEIGKKVGQVIHRYKVGKHFRMTIGEGSFSYERNKLDGQLIENVHVVMAQHILNVALRAGLI